MSGDLDLEQRYRRVLRLLPGYYRDRWEEDMVAAFPGAPPATPPSPRRPPITPKAFDSRVQTAIIVAGKTWVVPMTAQPLTNGQFGIAVPSKDQALQLQHTLLQPA